MKRWNRSWLIVGSLLALTVPAVGEGMPELPQPEFEETRELIDFVAGAAAMVAVDGAEMACTAFRDPSTAWYQGETYVFVITMDGEAVCNPGRPTLEGRTLMEMRDPHGQPIMHNILRELSDGDEGWVHYLWPRPGGETFYWKTAYVRRAVDAEGLEYVVGSGRYQMRMEPYFVVEQVNDAVALLEARGREAFGVLRDKSAGFRFYDGYVFVLDSQGTTLVNPAFPEEEGRSSLDRADSDGSLFVRRMIELAATEEGGWVEYRWPKPGDKVPASKSSFVRGVEVEGERLVVGAGVYFK